VRLFGMSALKRFKREPEVKNLLRPINFYRLVQANYKTKTCEQVIRDHLKPLIVPLEMWPILKECWESVVSDLRMRTAKKDEYMLVDGQRVYFKESFE